MSGDYCYVLFERDIPLTGGSKRYHILWWLRNTKFPERTQDFKNGRYVVLRLSPWKEGAVDITQDILNEI